MEYLTWLTAEKPHAIFHTYKGWHKLRWKKKTSHDQVPLMQLFSFSQAMPSLVEAALDPPRGFPTSSPSPSPSPSSRAQRTAMASISPSPTWFLSWTPYKRLHSLCFSAFSRGSSVLPRSAGHRGGGGRGESRQPILLPNGSRWKPIFCYPLPVKPHPVRLHPRLHCLSMEVWERREVSQLFSCSSASLGTQHSAQAPPSGLMADPLPGPPPPLWAAATSGCSRSTHLGLL